MATSVVTEICSRPEGPKPISTNFIQKITIVIDNIAPNRTKRIKGNSKELCDSKVAETISLRDRLFKELKRSRSPVDKEN